jgi:hypothetical protein
MPPLAMARQKKNSGLRRIGPLSRRSSPTLPSPCLLLRSDLARARGGTLVTISGSAAATTISPRR